DHDVYVLPGPMGQLFGGERSVATLLTRSRKPISSAAETALLADKGSFGYSNVRGRYSRRFADAREIDLSIGYRKGDGPAIYRRDDAYHYSGDIYFPVDGAYGVRTAGNLYDREGDYVVRPDFGGSQVRRERFDRSASISVDCHNSERSARGEFGYHHLRQGSYLSGVQKSRLNLTGHGLFALREWVRGNTAVKVDLSSDYLEYDDGFRNVSRTNVDLSLGVARWLTGLRWALTADAEYVESVGLLPSAAALLFRETDRFFAMLSAGYCEREASLLELHLPLRQSAIYGSAAASYTESGNSDLERERQLVANLTVEVGSIRTALALSLTGGKIFDGIDWQQSTIRDTLRVYAMFRPENGDVSFLDVAVQPRITIKDFARLNAGAAYHWLDYGTDSARPYTPTFQAFAGLELHVYWPQRLLHLYAYGEILYSDSYNGYAETALGEDPIANGKLSFAIKDFRMNFVFQNVFNRAYRSREHITFPGRYFYYGLTWSFLN
ncbi:MAG TPA: hypothetical protein VN285_01105, partial [Candidatus Deferrimicrobium sp.]|nr:hypothetical protein [Candidatus Deferrimicrobium sp.]